MSVSFSLVDCIIFVDDAVTVGVFLVLAGACGRPRAFKGKRVNVTNLAEERNQGQADESFVIADDPLNVQLSSFVENHDHGLLGDGKVTDHRRDTGHEGTLSLVGDRGDLTIEQRDLGSLHDVGSLVTLSGLQEEERFDVAENRKADR